ncbi:hypothetical protein V757_06525 [Pelistega indica]|uniref:TonB C-terminal domain-containing protein n=1 Tax=Pelistega indica TaxID=1414851 RepID=V8G4B0_9BURK|nr:energy transducer TonB [Pelistega indica]ETD71369.1 hypothetical protein V757_06525 [Pelistega indica]
MFKPINSQQFTPVGQKIDLNAKTTKAFGKPEGKKNVSAGSASAGPVRVTSVNYLVKPRPVMPRVSMMRNEKGLVVVRVIIDTNGAVKNASLQRSSSFAALDKEALRAVKQARFRPYAENGVPRESMADIPIEFK